MDQDRYNDSILKDFQRYIFDIYKTKRWNIKLTKSQHEILGIFWKKEIAHAYECRKYLLLRFNKKIAPNNVRKQILKLVELDLIKRKTMKENTIHNALYYTLSSFGIFYIINNSDLIEDDLNFPHIGIQSLFANHPFNSFFKLFLYPIIKPSIIKKIDNEDIFREVSFYLRDCSNSLKRMLDYILRIEKEGGYSSFVTSFPSILDASLTEIDAGSLPEFILDIKERFNITGLDEKKAKIEEIKKNKLFKIISNEKVLFLKLDEKKSKAILYQKNNNKREVICHFDLQKYVDIIFITQFIPQTIEKAILSYQSLLERSIERDHMPALIHRLLEAYSREYNSPSFTNEAAQSYILLVYDHKFMSLLEKIKRDFDSQYILFRSMTNNIY